MKDSIELTGNIEAFVVLKNGIKEFNGITAIIMTGQNLIRKEEISEIYLDEKKISSKTIADFGVGKITCLIGRGLGKPPL